MNWRSGLIITAVASGLMVAAAAKAIRYTDVASIDATESLDRVASLLAEAGWRLELDRGRGPAYTYRSAVFAKEGCPSDLEIAVLGSSGELVSLVFSDLGEDVIFIQAGEMRSRPSTIAYRMETAQRAAFGMLGRPTPPQHPILAVAPGTVGPCAAPPSSLWQQLSRG